MLMNLYTYTYIIKIFFFIDERCMNIIIIYKYYDSSLVLISDTLFCDVAIIHSILAKIISTAISIIINFCTNYEQHSMRVSY